MGQVVFRVRGDDQFFLAEGAVARLQPFHQVYERIGFGNKLLYGCVHTFPSTKVKELAHHLGYKFRHPDIDGTWVSIMLSRYLRTGQALDEWEPCLEYNEDDVAATLLLLETLQEFASHQGQAISKAKETFESKSGRSHRQVVN